MFIQGLRDWMAGIQRSYPTNGLVEFGHAPTIRIMRQQALSHIADADTTTAQLDTHPDIQRDWLDNIAEDYQWTCTLVQSLDAALEQLGVPA